MKHQPNYSSLFYYNPLPSWVYDLDTFQILDVNASALSHYGYTQVEFLALTILDLRPEAELPKLIDAHKDIAQREGNIYFGDFTHQKSDGSLLRMRINGHKVDYLGKICMLVVCQDITTMEDQLEKLMASEQALRDSETRFRTIFEIATLGIAQVDPHTGKIILVNAFYETITGYSEAELLEMSFVHLTHPEDRAEDWEYFSRALRGESEYRNEKRYIRKDGQVVWVRLHVAFIRDGQGRAVRTVAICEDISIKKQEEQRLRLLESVVVNTQDAILIAEGQAASDALPKIVYANDAFTAITGYTAAEVQGADFSLLAGAITASNAVEIINQSLRQQTSCSLTIQHYKKNGDTFWNDFTLTPVADARGQYKHWVAIARDITIQKNKEIEKELLGEISQNFSYENDLSKALHELCQTIAVHGVFDFVELWLPGLDRAAIVKMAHIAASPAAVVFYENSPYIKTFTPYEGLPGNVWATQRPVLWDSLSEKVEFIRKDAALQANIEAAMGIPLVFNQQLEGVLVVATQHSASYLKKFQNLFLQLEPFIGSEIHRKKLEYDLKHLYQAIPDLICVVDFEGRFLKINQAGCALLGYTEEAILYQTIDAFIHPEDIEITRFELEKQTQGHPTYYFENRYVTKSGDICWLSWTCNPSPAEGLVYATAKNITSEKKLRELHRTTSHMARIGSWEVDLRQGQVYWSEMLHQLHETDALHFVPDLAEGINFYREDFRVMVKEKIDQCMTFGTPIDLEAVIVTAQKNELWVRVIGNAEFVSGQCVRIFGSFQDIHDRKEAEMRLQTLADHLPGVVFQYLLYPDGTEELKYVTKGADRIWGITAAEAVSQLSLVWDQIKKGGDYASVKQSIATSIEKQSKWTAHWRYMMPSGVVHHHLGYGTPIFLTDGTVMFNSIVLDVTLEAKNARMLDEVTAMAKIGSWQMDLLPQSQAKMYWSPMTRKIMEVDDAYDPSPTKGFELYDDASRTKLQQAFEDLVSAGISFDEDLLVTTAKGHPKWIRCIGKSEYIQGQCVGIYGSIQDIDDTKSLAQKINEILGSISDAFYAVDAAWQFTYFNSEAERLLEKSEAAVLGQNLWEVFPEAIGSSLEATYRRVVDTQQPESFDYHFPGDGKWYEVNVYPSSGGLSTYFKNIDERKLARQKLEMAYQEKNDILESIGDAFFAMNKNFVVSYWNRKAEEILGVKREAILGKNLWEVFPDAVTLPSYTYYHQVLADKEAVTFEDYYGKWLEVNAYPALEGITVFFRDITLQKEAQDKIFKAYEEKVEILESIGDAFFSVNKHWEVTYWNKEAEKVLGMKKEAILGKNLWEVYDYVLDTAFYSEYHRAMATGKMVHFEEKNPVLGLWFEVSAYPSSHSLSVYFKDITLRKEADLRLKQAHERFERVTEATNDAIWDFDLVNQQLFWGKGFETLFGYQASKIQPTFEILVSLIHPEDRERVVQKINLFMQDPSCKDWHEEYRFLKQDQTYAYVIDRATFIRNHEGEVVRVIGAMGDMTERKKFEQQLLELNASLKQYARDLEISNEELEQFAFIASHDLQEPLRMVSSFMDQLRRKYGHQLDDKALQYIYFATDGAKRMKKIILDLLEFSRAGKFSEAPEMVDLNALIDNYKVLRNKVISDKAVVLDAAHLPVVETHKAPLTQVFHCLIDNAIHYSKPGQAPEINITVLDRQDFWEIAIADQGIGIDPKFHDKIFVIFQRLHNREAYDGTGIGLSIVKKHVESWGGKVWVASTLGAGATFYFTIPKLKS